MAYCFTLYSFAKMYADTYGQWHFLSSDFFLTDRTLGGFDARGFANRLWGDIYSYKDSGKLKFTRKAEDPETERTFVHFILNPLYKIYSHVLSEEADDLKETLHSVGIVLKPILYKMDVRPLLKVVLAQFFGSSTGLVDMIVNHIPSPVTAAAEKVVKTYTGPQTSEIVQSMKACDPEAPVMVQISKLYHTTDAQSFRAFGRVLSGTLRRGADIKVLGEGYSPEDEEDMLKATVEDLWIPESR